MELDKITDFSLSEIKRVNKARKYIKLFTILAIFLLVLSIVAIFLIFLNFRFSYKKNFDKKNFEKMKLTFFQNFFLVFFSSISSFIGILFLSSARKKAIFLKREIEINIITPLVENQFLNCKMERDKGFVASEIDTSGTIPKYDQFRSSHLVTGKYRNTTFKSANVSLLKRVQSRRGKRYAKVFNGTFIVFSFPKKIKGTVIVSEKAFYGKHFEKVKFESINFNEKFFVSAVDKHEAFYIITPQFIEAMLLLEKKYPGAISFSFVRDTLFFSIDNDKEIFAYDLRKNLDKSLIDNIKNDGKIIRSIIENLKLDKLEENNG